MPTPYTSQRCSKCGYTHPNNRPQDHKKPFCCKKCNHTEHSDVNAAKNIKLFGDFIWKNDIVKFLDTMLPELKSDRYIKLGQKISH